MVKSLHEFGIVETEVASAGMAHYSVFLNVSYPTDKQFGHIPITIQKNHGLTG
jgi:hypothetical protein